MATSLNFIDPRFPNPRRAHSYGLKVLLGMQPEDKLPIDGTEPVYINAEQREGATKIADVKVKVWVAERVVQRKVHRVRAECPFCLKEVSAGRLFQHRCN